MSSDQHQGALNSSWIRRLHVSASTPPSRTQTISSNESRTAERSNLYRIVRSGEEHGEEEVSGFGPFQFKATNNRRLHCGQNSADGEEGLKISPFFKFVPPLSPKDLSKNTNAAFQGQDSDYTNKQDEAFSYWNLGRFNNSSEISLRNSIQRKRSPITNLFFPSKFRRSDDES